MRNRTGQISIIASLLLAIGISTLSAQFIDNRLHLYAGYSLGSFHGLQMVSDGEFQYPALYSNLITLHGPGMELMWGLTNRLYIGLGMQHLTGDQWNFESETLYAGTSMAITSLQPVLQYNSGKGETNLANRIRFTAEARPSLGVSELSLHDSLTISSGEPGPEIPVIEGANLFFGLQGALGIDFSISQAAGIYVRYHFSHNWITQPTIYPDKVFTYSQLETGFIVRFIKDKRFMF